MKSISAIVLGAGKGTRMKSNLPKVLHNICGKPMLQRVLDTLNQLKIEKICLVLSKDFSGFRSLIQSNDLVVVTQNEQKGTADAVSSAYYGFLEVKKPPYTEGDLIEGDKIQSDITLICYGDTPLISKEVLSGFIEDFTKKSLDVSVLGMDQPDPFGYGRLIIDNSNNQLTKIVEQKDASSEELLVNICNSGIILAKTSLLFELLEEVSNKNSQKEYYLTDIIQIAVAKNLKASAFVTKDYKAFDGVNDKMQLSELERRLVHKIVDTHLKNGVTINLPHTVYIEDGVTIGNNTVIEPNVIIKGSSIIGDNCIIGSGSHIDNQKIESGKSIKPNSVLI